MSMACCREMPFARAACGGSGVSGAAVLLTSSSRWSDLRVGLPLLRRGDPGSSLSATAGDAGAALVPKLRLRKRVVAASSLASAAELAGARGKGEATFADFLGRPRPRLTGVSAALPPALAEGAASLDRMEGGAEGDVEGESEEADDSAASSGPRERLSRLISRPASCNGASSTTGLCSTACCLEGDTGAAVAGAEGKDNRELRRAEAEADELLGDAEVAVCGAARRTFDGGVRLASRADFLGLPRDLLGGGASGESSFRRAGLAVSLASSSSRL